VGYSELSRSNEASFISLEDKKEITSLINKQIEDYFTSKYQKEQELLLPVTIFKYKLSSLEIIVKYCRENLNLGFTEIAKLLNRNPKTIWATYNKAKQKFAQRIIPNKSKFFIPTFVFRQRKLSVLESIVVYLKHNYNLDFKSIAKLLNKSYSTILTVNRRAKLKE
jgi:16S rRNA C967 or C1407 C5-methylase (RsmB/RsmF family)